MFHSSTFARTYAECVILRPIKVFAWVHAYLHRVEGDEFNAAYWYNRAARPVCTTSLATEWDALYNELKGIQRN